MTRKSGPPGGRPFPGPPARYGKPGGKDARGPRPGRPPAGAPERPAHGPADAERLVVGNHPVLAVLQHQPSRAEKLLVQGEGHDDVVAAATAIGVAVQRLDGPRLDQLVPRGLVHQGVVLHCGPHPYVDIEDYAEAPGLTLVLDGVEDPRNLGAAARAAYALGADLVVIPRDRAAACTASAHKAAAGALARIAVAQVGNLKRAIEQLKEKGAWVVGAEADAKAAPWQVDLKGKTVLVIGGEDRGLRRLTRDACDHVVSVPMADGEISLNAADAATVLLYEAMRQRRG